jgi:hypothetical protein
MSPIELRPEPFQERLLEEIALARERDHHRNLLASATAAGKRDGAWAPRLERMSSLAASRSQVSNPVGPAYWTSSLSDGTQTNCDGSILKISESN